MGSVPPRQHPSTSPHCSPEAPAKREDRAVTPGCRNDGEQGAESIVPQPPGWSLGTCCGGEAGSGVAGVFGRAQPPAGL